MKNIFSNVVSKSKINPEFERVLVSKKYLVATDSYTLIEVSRDCFIGDDAIKLQIIDKLSKYQILLKPEELDLDNSLLKVFPINENLKFPDYKKVVPDTSKDYVSVKIDPRKLINIAKSIISATKSKYKEVNLYIPKSKNKPIVLERTDKKVIGLIMPMNE